MKCFTEVWPPFALSVTTATLCAILSLVVITGNSLIIIAVVKDPLKKLCNPFSYFLLNLTGSDLIVGMVTIPIAVYTCVQEALYPFHYEAEKEIVDICWMVLFVSVTASILSMVALSVDRYIAIIYAIKYRQHLSWRRCVLISILIWSISLSLPFLYFKLGHTNYLIFHSHSASVIALIAMVVTYVNINRYLHKRTQELNESAQRTSTTSDDGYNLRRQETEQRVTGTFFWILVLYITTLIPAMVIIYLIKFCHYRDSIVVLLKRVCMCKIRLEEDESHTTTSGEKEGNHMSCTTLDSITTQANDTK